MGRKKLDDICKYRISGLENLLGKEITICKSMSDCYYKSLVEVRYYKNKYQTRPEGDAHRCLYKPKGS